MNGGSITWPLFLACIALGIYSYRRTDELGRALSQFWRIAMRINFAVMVTLAAWSCSSFALWASGVELDIGIIKNGLMGEHYWLGPFTLIYAVFCYAMLRMQDRKTS